MQPAGIQPLHELTTSVPGILPGAETGLNGLRLLPNHRGLALLDEQLEALIIVTVTRDGEVVGEARSPITFLAFNQWMFRSEYFDSIAAFVQPNCAAVRLVLTRVGGGRDREILRSSAEADQRILQYRSSPGMASKISCEGIDGTPWARA